MLHIIRYYDRECVRIKHYARAAVSTSIFLTYIPMYNIYLYLPIFTYLGPDLEKRLNEYRTEILYFIPP